MKHKCFYLVGYQGCGKTTQANKLEKEFPHLNYVGGKRGLDTVRSVDELITLIKASKTDMLIHGVIFQTEPTLIKLSRLTDLHLIVLHSYPKTVQARTYQRGANDYNLQRFSMHYRFIRKLPTLKKIYPFKLSIVDNNRDVETVYKDIKNIVNA